jgi:hypothetical protein
MTVQWEPTAAHSFNEFSRFNCLKIFVFDKKNFKELKIFTHAVVMMMKHISRFPTNCLLNSILQPLNRAVLSTPSHEAQSHKELLEWFQLCERAWMEIKIGLCKAKISEVFSKFTRQKALNATTPITSAFAPSLAKEVKNL